MIRRTPRSSLFPYTTLYRTRGPPRAQVTTRAPAEDSRCTTARPIPALPPVTSTTRSWSVTFPFCPPPAGNNHVVRSEEHTSELQSRQYLVCRPLLEKKNLDL